MTNKTSIAIVACLVASLSFSAGCQKLRARDHLNKGVQAYKSARYPEAIEHFKQAIALDPTFPTARLYLATAYMVQYIPGAESPENLQFAENAHREFLRVLEQDPKNEVAIASIASLYFNQKKFDDAAEWYKKLIEVSPSNKEAYYTLGVIAWTKAFQDNAEARAKLGMRPEDPGPLKDKKVRDQLRQKNLEMIETGMKYLEKALELDPQYDDAMAYMNLLFRQRADLQETAEAYKRDWDTADTWVQKTLETKKQKTGGVAAGTP
ncbi:MAG: tetratricopeptide repeat protein [Bryobacterales bacterium]|nr:tetratricopeptide repeat protein [Bryobacteraceae bacterium]MDW8130876.1 tetratricopeptide repeat protein [Bryobacterales bacterium]